MLKINGKKNCKYCTLKEYFSLTNENTDILTFNCALNVTTSKLQFNFSELI